MTGEQLGVATRGHLGSLARGGALSLAGAVVAAGCGFALVAIVARGLPADRAGVFFAVVATFLIVGGLCGMGTETGLARFLLRHEAAGRPEAVVATIRAAAVVALPLALLLGFGLWASARTVADVLGWGTAGVEPLRVVAVVLPAAVTTDLCLAATRAFGEMRSTVVVDRLVRAGLQPILVGVALASGGGLVAVTVGWAASHVVGSVLAVLALRRTLRQRGGVMPPRRASGRSSRVFGEFWSFTWLRGLARVAQLGMQKVDILLVAALVSVEAAAVYTVATRFVPVGQMANQAIQQVLQPRFTTILLHDDRQTLREVYRVATAWSMLASWPVHLGVLVLATTYLSIFGSAMPGAEDAVAVVVLMASTMLLAVASGPVDTLLLMTGRSRTSAGNAFTALGIDVVLCLVLLPSLGILGAAIAWSAAVITRCSLAFWQVHRALGVHPVSAVTGWAFLLPVLTLALPLWLLGRQTSDPAVLVVGVLVCGAAYVAGVVHFRERLAFDGVWSALPLRRSAPAC